ncbi:MAG: rhamnogalacturonan acetylesterase [Ferruginibacter sp.]
MRKVILFSFPLVALMAFNAKKKINVWLIGDSTMAWKKPQNEPESGWGEGLKHFINSRAIVHNHAASGRSTKSFIDEKRWQTIIDSIQPGDYVVIQFGHNDEKPAASLHTDPFTTYKEYLKKFVDETRLKKGIPIICSSIIRRHFDSIGNLKNTHGDYIEASRQIAAETKTIFIDMEARSRKLVTEMGSEKSKSLFLFCNPGEYSTRPTGVQDSTHLNHYGAEVIASLFIDGLKEQKIKLARFAKEL